MIISLGRRWRLGRLVVISVRFPGVFGWSYCAGNLPVRHHGRTGMPDAEKAARVVVLSGIGKSDSFKPV